MSFRCKNDNELDRLSDDQLIAEIVAARNAGDNDCARKVLGVLANRRLPDLVRRARLKVPPEDAEDVAMEALASALKSAFDGTSVGEFVNWLKRILQYRIADYYEKGERTLDTEPLPEEHEGDEEVFGKNAAVEADPGPLIEMEDLVNRVLARFSEVHRLVIHHSVFRHEKGKETAKLVNELHFGGDLDPPMNEANVHTISKRFRDKLRSALQGQDPDDDDDDNE